MPCTNTTDIIQEKSQKMACEEVELREQKQREDDEDSLRDRCFEESYRGDSRKWLIRDGSKGKSLLPITSTMKSSFDVPDAYLRPNEGIRRKYLKEIWAEEAADEILKEQNEAPAVEEYCTEYDGNFNCEGFTPQDKQDRELYIKYPLYGSEPTTIYKSLIDNGPLHASIPGLTKYFDRKSPFKRYSGFTRPVDKVLDNPYDL